MDGRSELGYFSGSQAHIKRYVHMSGCVVARFRAIEAYFALAIVAMTELIDMYEYIPYTVTE